MNRRASFLPFIIHRSYFIVPQCCSSSHCFLYAASSSKFANPASLPILILMNQPAPLWKVSAAEFSKLVDVNIKGVANVIRAFVPAMIERNRGVIVNLSSGWGRSTSPDVAPYCASKWAIEGLTKSLAQELPGGMAAVPLNPGVINTDMLKKCFGSEAGSHPEAKEWAETAAPFILALGPKDNGQSLSVPGTPL